MSRCLQLIVVLLFGSLYAQDANFFTADGKKLMGNFMSMHNDTVYVSVTDTANVKHTIARHKTSFTKVVFVSGEYLNLALSNWPKTSADTTKAHLPTDTLKHAKTVDTTKSVNTVDSIKQRNALMASEQAAAQDTRPTVAVVDFDGRGGVSASDAATLSDRFREKLIATNAFRVMERNQMELILKEQGFQQTGTCKDNECIVQIGQLIAVRKIISGSVGKVGGMYTVSVKMLSVETGALDQNFSEDCDCPVEELLTVTMERLAKRFAGQKIEESTRKLEIKRGDASLYIKTNPDSARIYIDGKLVDGQTPLTIDNLTPGEHVVKTTKRELSGFATINLQSNKMGRLEINLAKQKTLLKVSSTPSEAEVYINGSPRTKSKADQITPAIFENIAADSMHITLFKVGYMDTTFGIRIVPNEITNISIPLADAPVEVIQLQKKMVSKKFNRKLSVYLSIPGIACMAAGGVCYYLSRKDFDDAATAKNTLENIASHTGSVYDALVNENKNKNDAAILKRNISYGLGGAGAAMLAAGIVLWF